MMFDEKKMLFIDVKELSYLKISAVPFPKKIFYKVVGGFKYGSENVDFFETDDSEKAVCLFEKIIEERNELKLKERETNRKS